ncbi:unnamed protein product [Cochlearia groenlandica]
MVKLWEKSMIAKIAIKRGVQLATSERMAEDLKKLTGGIFLCRNKDYLVFYRGKSFLSLEVAEALVEKERFVKTLQDEEEHARSSSALIVQNIQPMGKIVSAGTLGETLDASVKWGKNLDDGLHAKEVKHEAERKLLKAERGLAKVEEYLKPAEQRTEQESITDEERFMFRKLGLKMKAFLLLGNESSYLSLLLGKLVVESGNHCLILRRLLNVARAEQLKRFLELFWSPLVSASNAPSDSMAAFVSGFDRLRFFRSGDFQWWVYGFQYRTLFLLAPVTGSGFEYEIVLLLLRSLVIPAKTWLLLVLDIWI